MKWNFLVILSILFTGCSTRDINTIGVQSGDVIMQDDFSSKDSGWEIGASSTGQIDYSNGHYQIRVDRSRYDLWSTAGVRLSDVDIQVDGARIAGPAENRYGLICRYDRKQNYYFFIISSDGYYALGVSYESVNSILGEQMMSYSPLVNKGIFVNRIRLTCHGSELKGYVNEQLIIEVNDNRLTIGDVGLIAGSFTQPGVDIVFDNFVLRKP